MKKILTFTLLYLLLVGGARSQQPCTSPISSFPYFENFETGAGGWMAGGTNSSWALGTPIKQVINTAASGTNSWVTNLSGPYRANEQSYVMSPCFSTMSMTQPVLEMKIWWSSESNWDGAVLQSSSDGGLTWQRVGARNDPHNWYNNNTIKSGPGGQTPGSAHGWSGSTQTNNGSRGWVIAKHPLTGLGQQTNLRLRIAFASDTLFHEDGFAFDDVSIYDTPTNDASLTALTSPQSSVQPNVSTPVTVTLKNLGIANLTNAKLGFSVNGTTVLNNYSFSGNLTQNQSATALTIGNYTFQPGIHTLKAWSSQPNGLPDGDTSNDTITTTIYTCSTLSTYTINQNAPSSGTNFQSFGAAVRSLSICGIAGPVVLDVAAGSGPYTETVVLSNINGASATNTVTINGNGNTIINAATSGDALKLDGAKYYRISNLKVNSNPAATGGTVVTLTNSSQNNTFTGCTFTHSITTTTNSARVVALASGSSNNTFQNDTIIGGYVAIHNFGSSSSNSNSGNSFIGNVIQDPHNFGIHLQYNSNTLYEGNDISWPNRTSTSGIYGMYVANGNSGVTISKNRIHNTHDVAVVTTGTVYGIYCLAGGTSTGVNIIKNNLIYNINNNGGTLYGLYHSAGDNTYYYNNTVAFDDPTIVHNNLRGMHFSNAATNVKFINNIISLSTQATNKHALYVVNTGISLVSNNNVLYAPGGKVGYFAADKVTLADWQAVNNNAYDQASVAADPEFQDRASGNMKPTNATAHNIGQPLTDVTDDITNSPRSATTPDPGAFEVTPAQYDAGITAITSPAATILPGVSQPVTITFKNYGSNNLTSAVINWTVNGVAQTSYNWSGNLANNQTSGPVTIGNYTFPAGTFTLDVCITNPSGQPDGNNFNDCKAATIISCNALAGTYTINKNLPGSATNFVSFTSAANTLNSCGISGPVTINVAAGTGPYTEAVMFKDITGTSATNTITINGNGNTIVNPLVSVIYALSGDALTLNGAKYYRFDSLRVNSSVKALHGAVVALRNNAQNNTFTGCTFTHNNSTVSPYAQAVFLGAGSSNNTFRNNTTRGAYYAFLNNGTSSSINNGNTFTGNTIIDAHGSAFYNLNTTGTLIERNDISNPTRPNTFNFTGIYLSSSTGVTISKNRIHNTHGASSSLTGTVHGIYTSAAGTAGSENIIKNNIIYNINNVNGEFIGFYNTGGNNTYYYHNTVSVDQTRALHPILRGMHFGSSATNVKFINNIISLKSPATAKHAIYLNNPSISVVSNNNNLHAPNGNVGYYSSDKTTLADWKAANSSAYDQASLSADPVFKNGVTGDLRPSIVALDDKGQPLPAVTDDITGVTRPQTTPDLGAFEFTVQPDDVGIIAISGPSITGCGLTTTEPITVIIKNFGHVTQTNIPVAYKVGTGNFVNEIYTGSIAANATASFTFTALANLSASGTHTIVAMTNLNGDGDLTNNSDTLKVVNSLISNLQTVLDFESAASGLSRFITTVNSHSGLTEDPAASFGTGTKGLIMDGVTDAAWTMPTGSYSPWNTNPNHFAAAYLCFDPGTNGPNDSLYLHFDLKQLYKIANANTNLRIRVNGTPVGGNQTLPAKTYRPPFSGTGGTTNWTPIRIDLTDFANLPSIRIAFESNVSESYANGTGTANLIDNIRIRKVVASPSGTTKDLLAGQLNVYPNPSNGMFNVSLPEGKAFGMEVTDLTGRVILKQDAKGKTSLDLSKAAKGIYLLKVTTAGSATVKKIIVE
ncbi:T9SS type A sorting domain-containing protein [Adhaeribacter soli]|uniref:T9SS type A sorting domain-containing protein n=1 Tax=Adhaeribacter soli TaxID=2607655 RepID=A0A5N1IU84_9BACT|nr:T9SS type A sorting domain-containing protein [Adhaeribacter soli]KAA9333614.1 T9SS type A sorting domain-containing protein [Adhaeribacter soli]